MRYECLRVLDDWDMFDLCYMPDTNARICLAAAKSSVAAATTVAGTTTTPARVTVAATAPTPASVACPKCGTNKGGKRTCCTRGGSWFEKCGEPGDSNFEHTYAEGIQSCQDSASGQEEHAQVMLPNQRTTGRERKDTQQKNFDSVTDSMDGLYDSGVANSKGYDKISIFSVMISLSFPTILLHI